MKVMKQCRTEAGKKYKLAVLLTFEDQKFCPSDFSLIQRPEFIFDTSNDINSSSNLDLVY